MHDIINFIVNIASQLGYSGILIMMIIESSFIPFPSEVAMVPAGYLASIGQMNFAIAFGVGTIGAIIGSTINYMIAFKLGDKVIKNLIIKYGKYIFIKEKHYDRSKTYFQKHGSITIFIARFIPAIRQLISLPAGAFKMNFPKFVFYTGLGAGIWNLVLMSIGYIAGENKLLIKTYSKEALFTTLGIGIIIIFIYYLKNKKVKY